LILLDLKTEFTSATRTRTHAQFVSPEEPNPRPIVAIAAHGGTFITRKFAALFSLVNQYIDQLRMTANADASPHWRSLFYKNSHYSTPNLTLSEPFECAHRAQRSVSVKFSRSQLSGAS
jgi:hypothetical protein